MKRCTIAQITLLLVILCSVTVAIAQERNEKIMGIFASLNFPTGDFGGDRIRDAGDQMDFDGFAKMGFGIGGEYLIPLESPGLSIIISPAIILNGLDDSELKKELADEDYDFSVETSGWMNIPIMGGIHYQKENSPTLSYAGFAMLGLNLVYGPTIETKYDGYYKGTQKIEVGSGTSYGFCIGGQVEMDKKYLIGARIYSLGKPELDVDFEDDWTSEYGSGTDTDFTELEFSISLFQLSIGMRL